MRGGGKRTQFGDETIVDELVVGRQHDAEVERDLDLVICSKRQRQLHSVAEVVFARVTGKPKVATSPSERFDVIPPCSSRHAHTLARASASLRAATSRSTPVGIPSSTSATVRFRRDGEADERVGTARGGLSCGSCARIRWCKSARRGLGSSPSSLDELSPRPGVRVERLGLPAGLVEREHQLSHQALPERVVNDDSPQRRHELDLRGRVRAPRRLAIRTR